jgi:hypothetical protein
LAVFADQESEELGDDMSKTIESATSRLKLAVQ